MRFYRINEHTFEATSPQHAVVKWLSEFDPDLKQGETCTVFVECLGGTVVKDCLSFRLQVKLLEREFDLSVFKVGHHVAVFRGWTLTFHKD